MIKKSFKSLFSLCVAATLLVCTVTGCSQNPSPEKLVKTIQILGTSDVHGKFDAFDYASNKLDTNGSYTQVSQKVNELRAANPNTILVDAGDSIQGNMSDLFINDDLHPMIAAMNEMQYDSWTLGNHEFNYGAATIERIATQPKSAVLSGNIYKADGQRLGKPYTIKTIDDVNVAIIGMTTPNILLWDGAKLPGYNVTNPIEETQVAIKEIKDQHLAEIFVAVVHMGENKEYREDDSATALANACPELSAIVCGHAHQDIAGNKVNNAILTEPGKNAEHLSQISLNVSKNSSGFYEVVSSESDIISMKNGPIDTALEAKLKPYHDKAVENSNQVIGELTGGSLVPDAQVKGISQNQIQDTAFTHLILDAEESFAKQYVPDNARFVATTAVLDTTANIMPGPIKNCDVVKLYKFENKLCLINLTGTQLKKYMEWTEEYYNQYQPNDLTVSFNPDMASYNLDFFSGVNYEVNIANPIGSRIENLTYISDNTPVFDTDQIYVATSDYRYSTILKGQLFPDSELPVVHDFTNDELGMVRDMITHYIKETKNGQITNEFTPNWKLTGNNFEANYRKLVEKLTNDNIISIPKSNDGKHTNAKSITKSDVEQYTVSYPDIMQAN